MIHTHTVQCSMPGWRRRCFELYSFELSTKSLCL